MSKRRRRMLVVITIAACATLAGLAYDAWSAPSAEEAAETAQSWQDDMVDAIDPLLAAYEHETGISRNLWRDGPITAGCAENSARARRSFHFDIPTTDTTYSTIVDDARLTFVSFIVEVPTNLREYYTGETITNTTNDGSSFHEVVEFWREGYVLTLIIHAAPGEEPNVLVLVVDAYSTCV